MEILSFKMEDLPILSPILATQFDDFWSISVLESEIRNPNSYYIVAKQNEEIIGFAGIWFGYEEVHITNIVTKKSKRNLGVGTLLLTHLIQVVKSHKIPSITLEVREDNLAAIQLYEKFDFKIVGVRKNYYPNSMNAILMTKKL